MIEDIVSHASIDEIRAMEGYQELEQAAANAFRMGRSMATEDGNTEFDNPFESEELKKSWLYGFKGYRKMHPVKTLPKEEKVWNKEGF